MHRPRRVVIALALAGLSVGALVGPADAREPVSLGKARALVRERAASALSRRPASLRVTAFEAVEDRASRRGWYLAKVQPANGKADPAFLAYVEPASGRVVAVDRWRTVHRVARASKLDADVAASLGQGGRHTVAVWVRSPSARQVARRVHREAPAFVASSGQPVGVGRARARRARSLVRAAQTQAVKASVTPMAGRAASLGLRVEFASAIVPVMWVSGTVGQIRRLAGLPNVLRVQSSGTVGLSLGTAGASDQVTGKDGFSHARGFTGKGVRIAVVEYGNVSWGSPDLDGIPASRRESRTTEPGGQPTRESHPTSVMAIIASDTRRRRGIAPGAYYISSGTGGERGGAPSQAEDFRALQALENGVLPGKGDADVVNLSIGQETSRGAAAMRAFVDQVVERYGVSIAAAAGNRVSQVRCRRSGNPVVSPGTGWNVVTVGGVDDRGTTRWRDDTLYRDSCSGDPPGGTFKPEISAPGVRIRVNGRDHTGTSFATPQVAGAMALLIDQREDLRSRPYLIKAILLAGSFERRTVARTVHHKEGVGTLAMKWAHRAAANKRERGVQVAGSGETILSAGPEEEGCSALPAATIVPVETRGGRRVRFVISWQSHGYYDQGSSFGPTDDFVDARKSDIDLVVRTAAGKIKNAQRHVNRTVEVAQWKAVRSEMPYQVRIVPVDWDCDLETEPVGWAWVAPG
jgi:hypothetical protein